MKTFFKNIFKVSTLVMCVVTVISFAPTQVQSLPTRDLPLTFFVIPEYAGMRDGIGIVMVNFEFALLHNGAVVETQRTSAGGSVLFSYGYVSYIPDLSVQLVSAGRDRYGNEFVSQKTIVPLSEFENWGGGHRRFTWPFTPVSAITSTQDIGIRVSGELIPTIVPPTIIDGRTVVPVRAVTEALGASVDWNGATRSVTITRGNSTIIMTIDSDIATVDAVTTTLDVAPILINDTTMLPIRFIAESFDLDVEWDESSRTVIITTP